MNIWKI